MRSKNVVGNGMDKVCMQLKQILQPIQCGILAILDISLSIVHVNELCKISTLVGQYLFH